MQRVSKKGKEMQKPLCVIDYNSNFWEVNLKDQSLHMYVVKRKLMTKWYLKLFKMLLNSTVLNSIVVHRQATERNIEQLSYRIQLVEELFMKHANAAGMQIVPGRRASKSTIPRLIKRHFLRKMVPKTEKLKSQRRCVVSSEHRKKKSSVYCCQTCDVVVCFKDCCELYHMKLNY
jgi:hypothetical protein